MDNPSYIDSQALYKPQNICNSMKICFKTIHIRNIHLQLVHADIQLQSGAGVLLQITTV